MLGKTVCHLAFFEFFFLFLLLGTQGEALGFFLHLGHLYLTIETYVVAMREIEVEGVLIVPVRLEHNGYLLSCVGILVCLGVDYVVVIGYASVLCHLHVVEGHIEICLIALSLIGSPEGVVKEGRALVVVIASTIEVIELKAETEALVDISGEEHPHVVLSVGLVATGGIEEVGNGRESIGIEQFGRLGKEISVGLEIGIAREEVAVGGKACYAWGAEVARSVVFAIPACGEYTVHEEALDGITLCWHDIAELLVNSPDAYALGYLLVGSMERIEGGIRIERIIPDGEAVIIVGITNLCCSLAHKHAKQQQKYATLLRLLHYCFS